MKKILLLGDINSSHIQKWGSGIATLGYEVGIFSLSKPTHDWYSVFAIRLFGNRTFSKESFSQNKFLKFKYLISLLSLRKVIDDFIPDVIHAHYATSYGLVASLSKFRPRIISAWGSDVFDFPKKSFLSRALLKYVLRNADRIIVPGMTMQHEIELYSDTVVSVIPFGIDTEKFRNIQTKANDQFVIGIIKSLESIYGISFLIRAFEIIVKKYANKNPRLIITGDGNERQSLETLVKNLNLINYVTFTGKILQEDVPAMHNKFDIFACPSIHESFGVSVLEASACEKPVVATRVGGLKEVVEDKITGILVEPENVNELADAFSYFIENPDMIKKYGSEGRKLVIEKYNWKIILEQIDDLYKSLLS